MFKRSLLVVATSLLAGCSSVAATTPQVAETSTTIDAVSESEDASIASDVGVGETVEAHDAAAVEASHVDAVVSACPAVVYPSGLTLVPVEDATIEAAYAALGAASCTTPKCFLDVTDLRAPDGSSVDIHALVAAHFELYELLATEVDPNGTGSVDVAHAYSTKVLVSPDLVAHLETLRVDYGAAVDLTSGFRSIAHQRALCMSICGADQCTDSTGAVTCARNSRHMWGAAADMDLKYEAAANAASFPFVFHENGGTGPHLHVDMQACN
ncbi:MAG: hypothetical protein ACHREM_18655 [Polyangiales bacterium]